MPIQNPSLVVRFKTLDERIKRNLIQAGEDLAEIRDKELWRQGGFQNFKQYCESIGENYHWAWRQITAAKKAAQPRQIAPSEPSIKVPQRPRMALEPSAEEKEPELPPKPKSSSNGHMERMRPIVKDGTGIEVPPEIMELWSRNEEVQQLLGAISRIRLTLERAEEERDPLYRFVDYTGTISRLKMVSEELQCGKSYAVCPDCNGVMAKGCKTCRERGCLPKFYWDMQPEEKRKIRE